MSYIEDYLRDQARDLAAYQREFWYDHGGVEDWLEIERRFSIVRPTPRITVTTMTQAGILPTWTCAYCGGLRMASSHKCEGCGAART